MKSSEGMGDSDVCCGSDCVELKEGMGDSDWYCSIVVKEGEEKGGKVSDKASRA
jgi:hypothetical protein